MRPTNRDRCEEQFDPKPKPSVLVSSCDRSFTMTLFMVSYVYFCPLLTYFLCLRPVYISCKSFCVIFLTNRAEELPIILKIRSKLRLSNTTKKNEKCNNPTPNFFNKHITPLKHTSNHTCFFSVLFAESCHEEFVFAVIICSWPNM